MPELHSCIEKIIDADPNTFVIFFVYGCYYSESALNLLRKKNVPYKGYDINTITGQMPTLLQIFKKNADLIGFDVNHTTKPIIFYKNKFIGGFDQLKKYLS